MGKVCKSADLSQLYAFFNLDQQAVVEEVFETSEVIPATVSRIAKNCKTSKVTIRYSCDPSKLLDVGLSNKFVISHQTDFDEVDKSCSFSVQAKSKVLCPLKLQRPTGFDGGKAVCIVDNRDNQNVLANLNKRVDKLLSYMT